MPVRADDPIHMLEGSFLLDVRDDEIQTMTHMKTAETPSLLSFLTHGLSARIGGFLRQLEESLACTETLTILYDDVALDAILCGMNQVRQHQMTQLEDLEQILNLNHS